MQLAVEKFERGKMKKCLGESKDAMVKLTNIKHMWEDEVKKETVEEYVSREKPKTAADFISREYICEPAPLMSDKGFVFTKKPEENLNLFQQNEKDKLAALHYEHHVDAIPECVKIPEMPVYYDRSKIGSSQGGRLKNVLAARDSASAPGSRRKKTK